MGAAARVRGQVFLKVFGLLGQQLGFGSVLGLGFGLVGCFVMGLGRVQIGLVQLPLFARCRVTITEQRLRKPNLARSRRVSTSWCFSSSGSFIPIHCLVVSIYCTSKSSDLQFQSSSIVTSRGKVHHSDPLHCNFREIGLISSTCPTTTSGG